MKTKNEHKKTNTIGVVPLSGIESKLNLPWPDYCQPIGENYLALERSVIECAYAGCNSIWIVCNDDVAPLVKERVGDYIINPSCYSSRPHVKYFEEYKKYISVFYVPIHPKDRDRRDSLGWSVLHGCLTAFLVSSQISSWLAPKKYYISFPYGIYDPEIVLGHRKEINSEENFFLSVNGETVRDNRYLGFTLSPAEWKQIRYDLREKCTGGDKNIPHYERWSSRNFNLDKIFKNDNIVVHNKKEVSQYYELSSWLELRKYYGSLLSLERPKDKIIGPLYYKGIKDNE